MKHRLLLACALLPFMADLALGDIPLPSPVPAGILPTAADNLQRQHDELVRAHDAVEADIDHHNGDCKDVHADDHALVAVCQASQKHVLQELDAYKTARELYERAIKNLPPRAIPATVARIGASADVRDAFMIGADGKPHPFHTGDPLVANAEVVTGPHGHAQFLLLDDTVFTLGPNSDIVMDDFVYDPNTNAGTISAELAKGLFRFVSGKVAHRYPGNVKLRVPSGAIGDRGTEYEASVTEDGSVHLNCFKGEIYFVPNSGGPTISLKAGQMVEIDFDGRSSDPAPIKLTGH